ncbi:hypothetical protein N7539_001103 [Penicillium diatomitis]|uniref:Uncharacterized protein n=1 Tax=Penicillium diatomitis TaxID=2819901 RepID=A0A9W9XN21_9EURO|nr:uncharacterized protein N7539_001103 [Penicillium diatomitis]KAJ5495987.1 hypothetical protein N7539_001103 [Penicillium diatomitis]
MLASPGTVCDSKANLKYLSDTPAAPVTPPLASSQPPQPPLSIPPLAPTPGTSIWPSFFAIERRSFQDDLATIIDVLRSHEDHGLSIKFAHQIAHRTNYPGDMNYLINAVKDSTATKEHIARRHLLANIKSLTRMFLDYERDQASPCFGIRLTLILDLCKTLEHNLLREAYSYEEDETGSRTARYVAKALELVILQIGTLTLDGNVQADGQAVLAKGLARKKTVEVEAKAKNQKLSREGRELKRAWEMMQFAGMVGDDDCFCKACKEEAQAKVKGKRGDLAAAAAAAAAVYGIDLGRD